LRLVGYYLMSWNRPSEASQLFFRVLERRSFEPHSFRDLARAMIKIQRYELAAALYEVLLVGAWDSRFKRVSTIAREEYALLIKQALKSKGLRPSLNTLLRRRLALLGLQVKPSKLRVTVTWNTDNTDIDLWVIEANGTKCYYKRKRTKNGGSLLDDVTRGYGPERYQNIGGRSGTYEVKLHFYGHSSNVLGNETHVSILIVLNAGSPTERIIEKNLVLRESKEVVTIGKFRL